MVARIGSESLLRLRLYPMRGHRLLRSAGHLTLCSWIPCKAFVELVIFKRRGRKTTCGFMVHVHLSLLGMKCWLDAWLSHRSRHCQTSYSFI